MKSSHKKCQRYNDPGHAHVLRFSCFERRPFLSGNHSRLWTIEAIVRCRKKHDFHLWAYVLMPEHVHLLIWPWQESYSISAILSSLKQSVSKRALVHVRSTNPSFLRHMEDRQPGGKVHHRFWQRGGGYDRNLIEPHTIFRQIEYIHANPVRRGLCERPVDWPWSSAIEYESPGTGLLGIDRGSIPVLSES